MSDAKIPELKGIKEQSAQKKYVTQIAVQKLACIQRRGTVTRCVLIFGFVCRISVTIINAGIILMG